MASRLTACLQVAAEYGAMVARGSGGASGTTTVSGSMIDQLLNRWYSVVPFSPWLVAGGVGVLWLVLRGPQSSGSTGGAWSGLLGFVLRLALGLGAMYFAVRWWMLS
jgi:hypothetical protein